MPTNNTSLIQWTMCAAVMLSSPALAAHDAEYSQRYNSCMDAAAGVTASMRECSGAEYTRIDKILNARYQVLMKSLLPARALALRIAQRKWLVDRKRICDAEAADEGGGTLALIIADSCYLDKLAGRVKVLQAMR